MRKAIEMRKVGEIYLEIFAFSDNESHMEIKLSVDREEDKYFSFMTSAAFLTHLAARISPDGYERALELIREGAMTYKINEEPDLLQ